jgi:hypothetical protein
MQRVRAFGVAPRLPARAQPGLGHAVAAVIVLAGLLAALFAPGRFSPDSLDMYDQALRDRFTDWHSPILVGIWGVFDVAPELVLLLFVALVMVSAMLLIASETTIRWAVVATVVVCLWPMTIGVLVTVSKDAWFAGFVLAAAAASAYAIRRTGRTRWVLLGVAALGFWLAVAARPNAIVPVAAVLAFGWPLVTTDGARRRWLSRDGLKRVGMAFVLVVAIVLSQRIWTSVVVDPDHVHPEQPTYQFDLAALSARTGELLLPASSLTPGTTLDDVRAAVDEGESGALWFSEDPPVRWAVGPEAVSELREAWLTAIREHPIDMIEHRLAYAGSLLNIDRPAYSFYEPPALPAGWGFDFSLHRPFFPSFASWFGGTVATWGWYGWFRLWIWTLVLLVVGLSRRGRRSVAVRTLTAAGLGSLLSFMAAATSSGFRYAWFTMVCALLTLAIASSWVLQWSLDRRRRARRGRPQPRGPSDDPGGDDGDEIPQDREPVADVPMARQRSGSLPINAPSG